MDEQIIQDILTEIFSSLEPLDAQSAAILQFLKAKGIATDEELAPFLTQSGNAANVRWLAARVRIASLLTSALKTEDKPAEKNEAKKDKHEAADKSDDKPQSKLDSAETSKPDQSIKENQSEPQEKRVASDKQPYAKLDEPKADSSKAETSSQKAEAKSPADSSSQSVGSPSKGSSEKSMQSSSEQPVSSATARKKEDAA